MSWRRRFLAAALVSLAVTAALAIGILLAGDFGETEGKLLATTAAISLFSLLSLPGAVLYEQRRAPALAGAILLLAATGLLLAVALIWSGGGSEVLGKLLGTVAALAGATTQAGATLSRRRDGDARSLGLVFAATVLVAYVLAGLIVVLIWAGPDGEALPRVIAALAVLDVALVVAQPLVRRLGVEGTVRPAFRVRVKIETGEQQELEIEAHDFAEAAAAAIRRAERVGERVRSVERL